MLSKIEFLAELCTKLESHGITANADRCLRSRHQHSSCARCAQACPTSAITCDTELKLDPEKCTGCGACAAVCPGGALVATSPTNAELLARINRQAAETGAVAFACQRHLKEHPADLERSITVECIARLDESLLVDAALSGASVVCLVDGSCSQCPQSSVREGAFRAVETSNRLLSAWNIAGSVEVGSSPPSWIRPIPVEEPPASGLSRRGFFTALRGEGASVASAALPSIIASVIAPDEKTQSTGKPTLSDLPRELPVKWYSLRRSLLRIATKPVHPTLESTLWADVRFSANCNGCKICAELCPTEALISLECDGQTGVFFQPDKCNQCNLCRDICPRNCVEISVTIDPNDILDGKPRLLVRNNVQEIAEFEDPPEKKLARLLGCQVTC